jgi:hypothetical protein
MRLAPLVLVLATTTGNAAGRISLEAPLADQVTLAVYQQDDHTQAVLSLHLATTETEPIVANMTIRVPHGARFVGMSLALGDSSPSVATAMHHAIAERAFTSRIRRRWDPALLTQRDTSRDRDTYELRVYPLSLGAPATVELVLELPDGTTFIDAAREAPIISGVQSSIVKVTMPDGLLFASHSIAAVDKEMALYADDPAPRPANAVFVDLVPDREASSSSVALRPIVRRGLSELRSCFAKEPLNAGGVTLQFAVVAEGRVVAVSLTGAGREANECAMKATANWSFNNTTFDAKDPDTVVVSYPVMWIRT